MEGNSRRLKPCSILPLKIAGARENEGKQEIAFFLTIESFCGFYGVLVNSGIGGCESVLPKFEKYFMPHENETRETSFFSQKVQREIKTVAVYVSDMRLKTHCCNLGRETESQI